MTRFEFYIYIYYKELERKKSLSDSLTLPIGIITGLIAWLFYFFNTYITKVESKVPMWTFVIYISALVALVVAIYFLTLSYFEPKFKWKKYYFNITTAYNYYYIALANEYEKYYTKTNKEDDLEKILIEDFINCAQYNTTLNERKTARLLKAKICMVGCLFLSFGLLVFPMTNRSALSESKPQEVRIIDTVKIKHMNLATENQPPKEDKPKAQPGPEPKILPEKPVEDRPKIRIIPETKVPPPGKRLHS